MFAKPGEKPSQLSIFSAEDPPARTSVPPETAPESTAKNPASGEKWPGALASSPPGMSSGRTLRRLLAEDWIALSVISQTLVTPSRAGSSEPTTSEPPTAEKGSSSWPTPPAADSSNSARDGYRVLSHSGRTLLDAVRAWPTPVARDSKGPTSPNRHTPALPDAVRLFPRGQLNPAWVEALMGFPMGWTDGPADPGTLLLFGSPREP